MPSSSIVASFHASLTEAPPTSCPRAHPVGSSQARRAVLARAAAEPSPRLDSHILERRFPFTTGGSS